MMTINLGLRLTRLLKLHRLHSCILHTALQARVALQARYLQSVKITVSLNLAQFTSDFHNSSILICLSKSVTTSKCTLLRCTCLCSRRDCRIRDEGVPTLVWPAGVNKCHSFPPCTSSRVIPVARNHASFWKRMFQSGVEVSTSRMPSDSASSDC